MLFEDDGNEKYKFPKSFYGLKKLTSDIRTFRVLQALIAVQENLLKKKENFI